MATAKYVCDVCGEQNEVGTTFCVSCHAYLAWDEVQRREAAEPNNLAGGDPDSTEIRPRPEPPAGTGDVASPQRVAPTNATSPSTPRVPADTTAGRFRVVVERAAVTVAATGEPAVLTVRVTNTSTIVDGYAVEAPDAPGWLTVEADDVQLLPGTEEALSVRMRVVSPTLVPAQQIRLVLSIRSTSQAPAHSTFPSCSPSRCWTYRSGCAPNLGCCGYETVTPPRAPCSSTTRAATGPQRSGSPARTRNRQCSFTSSPPTLEVGPGESGSVQLTVTAARPDPGQEISRILTMTATDGARTIETRSPSNRRERSGWRTLR